MADILMYALARCLRSCIILSHLHLSTYPPRPSRARNLNGTSCVLEQFARGGLYARVWSLADSDKIPLSSSPSLSKA